jgi:hypothetical protein
MSDIIGPENVERMPVPAGQAEHGDKAILQEKKAEVAIEKIIAEKKRTGPPPSVSLPIPEAKADFSGTSIATTAKIEEELAAGLDKVYLSLDATTQAKFRVEGEKTAIAIAKLLQKTKIKTKEIIKLIINWLRIIPRINKHFIEQEAKIKADRILQMQKNKKL